MIGILARAEDDFRHADTQGAMVIDIGKAQVFEGHVTQLLYGFVRREFAAAHICQRVS